jgi:DNA modification methylase
MPHHTSSQASWQAGLNGLYYCLVRKMPAALFRFHLGRANFQMFIKRHHKEKNEFASVHGATFPVHLPEFVIGDLMNRCRGVVDCFLGTGTTIIAAEKLGRDGRGIELSPSYVDVSIKRWQDFTGQQARHAVTELTFDEMSKDRKGPGE